MANSLLTIDMITREALRLFINTNAFLRRVDRQYDDQFAKTGAKIGSTLRIRLPNDYTVRTGKNAVVQGTNEQNTVLTVATQKGVDLSFGSVEMAMSLDDYSTRVLRPAMNALAGDVAADLFNVAAGVPNLAFNKPGDNLLSPVAGTWLDAGAQLDTLSAPKDPQRTIIMSPRTQANTAASLMGLFNPQVKIGNQYETGELSSNTLGFDWFMDQTVGVHTTGTYAGDSTVNGAGQTGSTITVSALGAPLKKGDVIKFAGVYSVNRVTKQSTGEIATFVVTADVAAAATAIPIYPALIPAGANGAAVAYQTVTASPANGAAVTLVLSGSYRQNLAFFKEAFTLATADLELPRGVHAASRASYGGISLRIVQQYNVMTDDFVTRLDILYGWAAPRPEWACIVADPIAAAA